MLIGMDGSQAYNAPGGAGSAAAGPGTPQEWQGSPDAVISRAINRYRLPQVGWRGFEALPWVKELHERNPRIEGLASTCSSHDEARYTRDLESLMAKSDPQDGPAILAYFCGKLALEELSCRRSGAGAGMCDKRSAYMKIVGTLQEEIH